MKPFQQPKEVLSKQIKLNLNDKPVFIQHLQNLTVDKGNKAVFEAAVKSGPSTQVNWYRNGVLIQPSTDYIISYDTNSGLSTLTLSQAFPEDSGQYSCAASNPAGEDSSTAWLVVKGKFFTLKR